MWLDLLALTLVCVAAGFGAARGTLAGAVGLAALVGAYSAAFVAGPAVAPGLASAAGMGALPATALAGTLAFVLAYAALRLAGRWLLQIEERGVGLRRSGLDRFGGGLLGVLRGAIVAGLVAWLALITDGLRATGAAPALPPLGQSIAARLASSAVEAGTLAAMGPDAAGRVAARLASRPAATFEELDAVLDDRRVLALRDDALFWSSVENGQTDRALRRASFAALAEDAGFRRRLSALGLVDARAAEDPAAFRSEMAEVLEETGPRLRALREDPELERLMQDPELLALARSGDSLALATHPRVRALAARAMASGR